MLKHLSGDSLQLLVVCLLSTLFSIAISAKYKVTESMTYSKLLCTYQQDYIVTCHVSNLFRGLYSMLPRLSLALCRLIHMARSSAHISSHVNLDLPRNK